HADGQLVPVEYKQGHQGKWSNDEAQLCAQALCLEEMTGKAIPEGALFYFGSRRRVTVPFTEALRAQTRSYLQQIRLTLAHDRIPAHTDQPQRCQGCSLYEVCLPKETAQLHHTGKQR
ncbi:MAG: CRISPR-associated protein Cas4, partial [Caldilineaceae bacterium]|nr:CRISPR-associated protein Cas4 [Caldilineaceae bacterium]